MPPQKKKASPQIAPEKKSDLEKLDGLLERLYENFPANPKGVKVTDILKVIELKAKLKPDSSQSEFEKLFWKLLNKIRSQELAEKKTPKNSLSGSESSVVSDTTGLNLSAPPRQASVAEQYREKESDVA